MVRELNEVPPTIPMHIFEFVNFSHLTERVRSDVPLTDVLGRIAAIGPVQTKIANGISVNTLQIDLELQVRVCLIEL
ncbi:hypothetical protein COLO4_30115 [Corchorus olitorius]|uniref:Uncharacterized protein n=1 Tax=Corchorus olitorius TaxID=93759 RepID=A0A1R3HB61_9ROSI|nr:hypothetical protein COLO4_30115 [Corchorus olitorius]